MTGPEINRRWPLAVPALGIFRRLFVAAVWAGLVAGGLLTLVQRQEVIPLLLAAETFEAQAEAHAPAAAMKAQDAPATWQPAAGWERTLYTLLANLTLGLGDALLLAGLITLRGRQTDWRTGLLWGLAGYVVVFVAPALGLPPEVPGTEAAALAARQGWWLATVLATALGAWTVVFATPLWGRAAGVVVLALPHLWGAPLPTVAGSAAPEELVHAFRIATAIANAVFWLALGGVVGTLLRPPPAVAPSGP